jgi:photosystem II stability/assembly factor-like uncharacterized protein
MSNRRILSYVLLGVLAVAAAAVLASRSISVAETTVSDLTGETHFHGIAVDPRNPDRLYLATHHGLFAVGPDGVAQRISETEHDFMGFTPHPNDPEVLYASGHPAGGGNLGFIVSRDGGQSWAKLSDGVGGPVDFHQMDISKADPQVIYGVYGELQKSTDGGQSWSRVGPAPEGIIGLAASSIDADRLYAATRSGLLVSTDGGQSWRPAHDSQQLASMVQVTPGGAVYAFIADLGLLKAEEPGFQWTPVSNDFGDTLVLHLAAGRGEEAQQRLYVVTFDPETRSQALYASRDGGRSWTRLGAA